MPFKTTIAQQLNPTFRVQSKNMIRITNACHTDTPHCTTSCIRILLGARAGYTAKHLPVDMRNVDCIRNFSEQNIKYIYRNICKIIGVRHSLIHWFQRMAKMYATFRHEKGRQITNTRNCS